VDGFRAIAYVNKDLSLKSRNGKELKDIFPELEELGQVAHNVVLDGEIVVMKKAKLIFKRCLKEEKSSHQLKLSFRQIDPQQYTLFSTS